MKKAISFALWGDSPKYNIGAIKNAELTNEIYPGWDSFFYVNSISVPQKTIEVLKSIPNCNVIETIDNDSWANMFWRFNTIFDSNISISIFRDTDSRLNLREKAAVEQWLNSDKTFHIMRDHPYHGFPILGGMWGYKHSDKYDFKKLLASFEQANEYGTDYNFFAKVLYPIIGDDKLVHDEFFDKQPFPLSRIDTEFVGDVFDENNTRHSEFWKAIPTTNA